MTAGPIRMVLPSGRPVEVRADDPPAPIDDDTVDGEPLFSGRLLNAAGRGTLQVRPAAGGDRWDRDALLELPLRDYHALRDVAERAGAIAADPQEMSCRNCGAPLEADPRRAPMLDLDSWYADDDPPPPSPMPLPEPVRLPSGEQAATVSLAPIRARDAMPLWRALGRDETSITPELVRALGIRALGPSDDPAAIATALENASEAVWDGIAVWFIAVQYAERATVPVVCGACGAVHDAPAPSTQELEPPPEAFRLLAASDTDVSADAPFPDEATFTERAEQIADEVYEARAVRNIPLMIDTDVPPVDGSGEPLLGSYQPIQQTDFAGYTDTRFEIRLYYRSFRAQWEQDGPFDLEGEIRHTIDHEVEHHLCFLAGYDPMDASEREQAHRELARTFGERAVRRARLREVAAELGRIALLLLGTGAVLALIVAVLYALGVLQE